MKGIHAEFKCLHYLLLFSAATAAGGGSSDVGLAVRTERTCTCHVFECRNFQVLTKNLKRNFFFIRASSSSSSVFRVLLGVPVNSALCETFISSQLIITPAQTKTETTSAARVTLNFFGSSQKHLEETQNDKDAPNSS